jgi:hypothetical protein
LGASFQRALGLSREIDAAHNEALALAGLGRCARAIGRLAEAQSHLRQAAQMTVAGEPR